MRQAIATVTLALLLCWTGLRASDVDALLEQGARQTAAGEIDAALASYRSAVAQDPGSPRANMKLAGLELVKQRYRASVEHFQTVIGLEPDNANAFVGMAVAYLHLGDYGLARAALMEAERLDPQKQDDIACVLQWIDMRAAGPH
jgi:cytochrome c-type biogenesis protein CcmH/NrfG